MMVPEIVTRRRLTLKDYEQLPDDQDYEIVDGALYLAPRARLGHQVISASLTALIFGYCENRNLGAVIPDTDLIIDDRNTYLSPDIMYFEGDRFASVRKDDWLRIIPDLAIEILSPSSEIYDRRTKRRVYAEIGVANYWIVDPRRLALFEHVLQPDGTYDENRVGGDEVFRPRLFPGLDIDVAQLLR
jgi:Uma2 family endonuclease